MTKTGLEVFVPTPRTVQVGGRGVDILPQRLRGLQRFGALCAPIAGLLMEAGYQTVLTEHEDTAFAVLRAATDLSDAELDALWPDEGVALLAAIYEVNADFFIRRLRPALAQAVKGAGEILAATEAEAGLKPSPGSSSTDTALPTASI